MQHIGKGMGFGVSWISSNQESKFFIVIVDSFMQILTLCDVTTKIVERWSTLTEKKYKVGNVFLLFM